MTVRGLPGVPCDASGVTLVELLVAAAIFIVVAFGISSLYLFVARSFDQASAEAFLQRQGTLIEGRLTGHILRASALQVAACGPTGVTIPVSQSIIYQRQVQNPGTGALQSEFWCIYQYQPTGYPYPLLWRCQVTGLTAPQDCTTVPGENLLAGMPVPPGQAVAVRNTTFAVAPVVGAVAMTVDIRFDLDLRVVSSDQSLLFSPRRFGFNTTIRN